MGSLESRVLDNLRLNLQVRVEGILNIKKKLSKSYILGNFVYTLGTVVGRGLTLE